MIRSLYAYQSTNEGRLEAGNGITPTTGLQEIPCHAENGYGMHGEYIVDDDSWWSIIRGWNQQK